MLTELPPVQVFFFFFFYVFYTQMTTLTKYVILANHTASRCRFYQTVSIYSMV